MYFRTNKNIAVFRITKIENLRNIIIPHFNKYPLISQKSIDFYLWSKVIEIIFRKEHLTQSGVLTILCYYAAINRGISKKVLMFYPHPLLLQFAKQRQKIKPQIRKK